MTGSQTIKPHPGWHSRGYLPHFDRPGLLQVVTFRLADSLPASVLRQMEVDATLAHDEERFHQIERQLDCGYGACDLGQPAIASLVQQSLLHFDKQHYRLMSWVIMPNHVHALVEVQDGHPLSEVVQAWKGYTAHCANKILHREGAFWSIEYFDRFIRDTDHFERSVHYIHNNPVKAGLVLRAEDWPFSSAHLGPQTSSSAPGPQTSSSAGEIHR